MGGLEANDLQPSSLTALAMLTMLQTLCGRLEYLLQRTGDGNIGQIPKERYL